MRPTSRDICIMLQEAISELRVGENLFSGKMPAKPDNCVAVLDIPSEMPVIYLDGAVKELFAGAQVRVRDVSYQKGWELINRVLFALHGINNVEVEGVKYKVIRATINPFLLEVDENNRNIFVCSFKIYKQGV